MISILLPRGHIEALASKGRMTLQIPEIPNGVTDGEEVPNACLEYLTIAKFPTTAKSGYLFLTQAGWGAYQARLRTAFLGCPSLMRHAFGWKDFVREVDLHFKDRRQVILQEISRLRRRKMDLEALL